jgi:hypothetical protein
VNRLVGEKIAQNIGQPIFGEHLVNHFYHGNKQSDQMSLRIWRLKYGPNAQPVHTVEKCSPSICATSEIFKKLPKENNRPIVENSPNHVTLEKQSPKIWGY